MLPAARPYGWSKPPDLDTNSLPCGSLVGADGSSVALPSPHLDTNSLPRGSLVRGVGSSLALPSPHLDTNSLPCGSLVRAVGSSLALPSPHLDTNSLPCGSLVRGVGSSLALPSPTEPDATVGSRLGQRAAKDLAAATERDLVHEHDLLGALVPGEAVGTERDQLVLLDRPARCDHDVRLDGLACIWVRNADHPAR